MEDTNFEELITTAEEFFEDNKYTNAESILNQLILKGCKDARVFHMLGTIYYDQGKFNKGIRAFKRALELDPSFTDASVGLSIILNDLGRYDEGRKVFEEAKAMLSTHSSNSDPFINEKLAMKHDELAELYYQYGRFNEALEQFYKALNLTQKSTEVGMKIVECYLKLEARDKAIKELRRLIDEHPNFYNARLKLGNLYFEDNRFHLAREEWQNILRLDSSHEEAKKLLDQLDRKPVSIEQEFNF